MLKLLTPDIIYCATFSGYETQCQSIENLFPCADKFMGFFRLIRNEQRNERLVFWPEMEVVRNEPPKPIKTKLDLCVIGKRKVWAVELKTSHSIFGKEHEYALMQPTYTLAKERSLTVNHLINDTTMTSPAFQQMGMAVKEFLAPLTVRSEIQDIYQQPIILVRMILIIVHVNHPHSIEYAVCDLSNHEIPQFDLFLED